MNRIALPSPVALIDDVPNQNLTKVQMGAVVDFLEHAREQALLVEFSGWASWTYALADVKPYQPLALHRKIGTT